MARSRDEDLAAVTLQLFPINNAQATEISLEIWDYAFGTNKNPFSFWRRDF
jgi:hypothetical protein